MTFFGKFASASVAALTLCSSTPALAGSAQRPIHVFCEGNGLASLCAALGDALRQAQDARSVAVSEDLSAASLSIRFEATKQSDHLLSGHLSWRDRAGATGHGPEIELTVIDSVITHDLLADYARTLVQHSSLPL